VIIIAVGVASLALGFGVLRWQYQKRYRPVGHAPVTQETQLVA
jgi:hypothetical protein